MDIQPSLRTGGDRSSLRDTTPHAFVHTRYGTGQVSRL